MKKLSKEDLHKFLQSTGLAFKTPFTEEDLLEAMNHAFELGQEEAKCSHILLNDDHLKEIVDTIETSMTGYNVSGTINGCVTTKEIPKIVSKLKNIKFNH